MSSPLGPVEIGAREIYDAVLRLQGAVDRLADHQDATRERLDDHEHRLRAGERLRWPLPALSVAIAAAALLLTMLPILIGTPAK